MQKIAKNNYLIYQWLRNSLGCESMLTKKIDRVKWKHTENWTGKLKNRLIALFPGDTCLLCLLWMPKCSETAIVTTKGTPCQCIAITTASHYVPTVKLDGCDWTVVSTQILHTECMNWRVNSQKITSKKTIYQRDYSNNLDGFKNDWVNKDKCIAWQEVTSTFNRTHSVQLQDECESNRSCEDTVN